MVDGVMQEQEGAVRQNEELGARWVVPAGTVVSAPIQLISVRTPECKEALQFANEWIVEDQAEAKLLICDHTLSFDPFTTTQHTRIKVGAGARFELIVMQNEHNESVHHSDFHVELERDSFFRCTFVTLHGGRLQNQMKVHLNECGANCEMNGLFLADGTQQVTFHIEAQHHAPQCISNQLFKGILDDRARAIFEGVIRVDSGAQKTQAYQANHNLLLTHESKIFTRPQLEIYADDVKCSHGATVGRLDESALFYLRSRGIGLNEARTMQQLAFLHDVLAQITIEPLRNRLLDLVERRLRGAFAQCGDCSMHCC
jgi:Fe-S cluster assembly protein SufD